MFNNYLVRFFLRILIPATFGVALLAYNVRNSDEEEKKELIKFVLWAILIGFVASKLSVCLTQFVKVLFHPSESRYILNHFFRSISNKSSFVAMFLAMYLLLTTRYKNIAHKCGNVFVPSVSLFLLFVYSFSCFNIMQHMRRQTPGQIFYNSFLVSKYSTILLVLFALTALIISQRKIKTAKPGKVLNVYMLAYFLVQLLFFIAHLFTSPRMGYSIHYFVDICICVFGAYLAYRYLSSKELEYDYSESKNVEDGIMKNEDSDVERQNPHKGRRFLFGFLISSISLPIIAWIVIALTDGSDMALNLMIPVSVLGFLLLGGFLLHRDTKNIWYIFGFFIGLIAAPLIFFGSCLALFAGSSW